MKMSFLAALVGAAAVANTAPSLKGTVARFVLAPRGEVRGILLKDGTSVNFAPHLGEEVTRSFKAGDTVVVTTTATPGALTKFGRGVQAVALENRTSGKKITDAPPTAPPPPPGADTRTAQTAKGRVEHFLVNGEGKLDGVILAEGSEVTFPPHVGDRLSTLIANKKRGELVATGPSTKNGYGTVIEATALTFDGNVVPGLDAPPPRP